MLKLYVIGICILLIAIIANAVIGKLGIMSWYEFLDQLAKQGFSSVKNIGLINAIWLFIGYPLVLSLGYVIGLKVYNLF